MTDRLRYETILGAFSGVLSRLCEQAQLEVSPDMLLADIPGIDSLRLLQAVALLEEHFRVEIDVVALEELNRVSDLLDAISSARPMGNELPGV
jgi:acyl carrier protein